ncbi:hypothetical protein GCM10007160_14760 [Litchfieldella qijiaojingensis]|uniref:Toxin VasX N-terminal region domain-containing protein n=1 Tax=Litchfieldella qijiaojingensis TaxID=980347 RepID=A0ABQ2YPG9_9GAMM|nr:hypothetical protein GCM10007160_14760 [Halomonas qijiaojingensis]
MRDGYLYVLDGHTNTLDEYRFSDQGATVSGKLDYPNDRTLYVGFSEVPWSDAKKAQVTDSAADRDAFLQAVDLAGAGPITGGEHLIPLDKATQWVAEFAEDHAPEPPSTATPRKARPTTGSTPPTTTRPASASCTAPTPSRNPTSACACWCATTSA